MPVAKTYTNWKQMGEPYVKNGKSYVLVEKPAGGTKEVRIYSQTEWNKMYGVVSTDQPAINYRSILGFGDLGYVYIFRGDTSVHEDYFNRSVARYHKYWGWYVTSTDELPADLPEGIEPVKLKWESVSLPNGDLLSQDRIRAEVENALFVGDDSEFVGEIGERLDIEVIVERVLDFTGPYGVSHMHLMKNDSGNTFVWTTGAKLLKVGNKFLLRGTVKEHKIYRNCKQTVLTRCNILKEWEN